MTRLRRSMLAIPILTLTLLLAACAPAVFAVLRAGVAASGPAITYAVNHNLITQPRADDLKQDFKDLVDASERGDRAFAVAKTRPEKFAAIQSVEHDWAAIVGRGHFIKVPSQFTDAQEIINGIFATILAFYAPPSATMRPKPGAPQSEKDLKAYLDVQSKKLKAALATH